MRKLASIQKVIALDAIPDADAIEKATVLGWQLVVKKNEFKVSDLCVYCEIDSLFPERPEFEFLKPRGMRIKTIRLRGQVSQGICFQLSILPSNFPIEEDADCAEVLGITKYEAPVPAHLSGVAKGRFPSFIPKTDETRVQVMQAVLSQLINEPCYITEKVDGSSATYYIKDGEFGVGSRNLELVDTNENTYWIVARELNIETKLQSLNGNYALQGELVGENIQGNKLKLKGQTVFFFNAFDIDNYKFFSFDRFISLMAQMQLEPVPIHNEYYLLTDNIEELVQMSQVKSKINKEAWAEGLVIRTISDGIKLTEPSEYFNHGRLTFKVINPEFLLKYGE